MGVSSSKFKKQQQQQQHQHYPPFPQYPPYPGPYPPIQPGQHQPLPPGFVPQGFVPNGYPAFAPPGQQAPAPAQPPIQMPQAPPAPLPQQAQQSTRRKKRRHHSTGHQPGGPSFPQPQAPTRAASTSHRGLDEGGGGGAPPPLFFTPRNAEHPLTSFPSPDMGAGGAGGAGSRAASAAARHRQTPFAAPRQMSRESSESDDAPPPPQPIHYETPRDPDPTMRVLLPSDPAPAAAYGPPEIDMSAPIKHPLPPPPRDLYELTPYRTLFNLPQTTALLTATYGEGMNAPLGVAPPQQQAAPVQPERKRTRKGLFRAFSSRRSDREREQQPVQQAEPVRYVPVFIPVNGTPEAGGGAAGAASGASPTDAQHHHHHHQQQPQQQQQQPPPPQPQPMFQDAPRDMHDPNSIIPGPPPPPQQQPNTAPVIPPQTMFAPSPTSSTSSAPPIIRFDQTSPYAGFLNHSPFRIVYKNKTYPSATHLHEAMKYIDTRPEVAEYIRNCTNIHEVYPLSARYQQYQRTDWGNVFLGVMQDVLWAKFKQHPDLRSLLLKTGEAILRYADSQDGYWGEGPDGLGRNELGNALMRVRRRLLEEGIHS